MTTPKPNSTLHHASKAYKILAVDYLNPTYFMVRLKRRGRTFWATGSEEGILHLVETTKMRVA